MTSELVFRNNFLPFGEYAKVSLRYTFRAKPVTYILVLPLIAIIAFWLITPWVATSFAAFLQVVTNNATIVVLTILLAVTPFSTWHSLKKHYASARFMQAPADYTFSGSGLEMNSPVTQSQTSWEAFNSFYDFGRYGVLMTSNMTGFFLDFSALQAPAVKEDFLGLLRSHKLPIK